MNKEICNYKNQKWKSNINEIIDFCEGKDICIYGAGLYGQFTKDKLL